MNVHNGHALVVCFASNWRQAINLNCKLCLNMDTAPSVTQLLYRILNSLFTPTVRGLRNGVAIQGQTPSSVVSQVISAIGVGTGGGARGSLAPPLSREGAAEGVLRRPTFGLAHISRSRQDPSSFANTSPRYWLLTNLSGVLRNS